MFTVTIKEKGGQKKHVRIEGNSAQFGREQGNDVTLPIGNVSKKHCRIDFRKGQFVLEDIGSTNGTYVNGRKISGPAIVQEGDKIYIGEFIVTLKTNSPPTDETEPSSSAHLPSRPPPPAPRPREPKSVPPAVPPPPMRTPKAPADIPNPTAAKPLPIPRKTVEMLSRSISEPAERLEQLLDFVAIEVKSVDRRNMPCRVDADTAGRIRMILRGMITELIRERKLTENEDPQALLMDAFVRIVDTGPIRQFLTDRTVVEIQMVGVDTLDIRNETGWAVSSQCVENVAEVSRIIRCLGAGLPGSRFDGISGCARFRLETGELIVAQLEPIAMSPTLRIYKNLSPRLDSRSGISTALSTDVLRCLRESITQGTRIAVCGETFTTRLSVLTDLARMLPQDDLTVIAEASPLLGAGTGNGTRIVLDGDALHGNRLEMEPMEALLNAAVQLNPKWIIAGGTPWSGVPALFGICAQRSRIIADIPLSGPDISEAQISAGFLSCGVSISRKNALDTLLFAFDVLITTDSRMDGSAEVSGIYRAHRTAEETTLDKIL